MLAQPLAQPDITTLTAWPQAKSTFPPPLNKRGETEVLPEKHSLTHVTKYRQRGWFLPHPLLSCAAEELLNQLVRSGGRV